MFGSYELSSSLEHHFTGGDGNWDFRPVPALPSRWSPWERVLASFECGIIPDHASLATSSFQAR
jgi:hypothetical protein